MITRARRMFGIGIALAVAVTSTSASVPGAESPGNARRAAAICGAPPARVVEHQYTVRARIRPLLFWTGRRDVGAAWFGSRASSAGGARLELLIGTDPDRAPMRVNRWGYIAETICDDRTELIGLMTESNEQTLEQAQAATKGGQRGQVKAIRAHASGRSVATEILALSPPGSVTYRDLDSVLAGLPASGALRETDVPPGTDSGFLVAVTRLIHDSVTSHRESGLAREDLRRTYVYAGRLYDVALMSSAVHEIRSSTVLESAFQIRNRATGSTTDFHISYPVAGDNAEVPVRIAYRPRWWLELELQRESNP